MKSIRTNIILNSIKQFCALAFPIITITYANRILGAENIGRFSFSNTTMSYFATFAALGVSVYGMRNGAQIRDNKNKLEKFVSEVYSINIIMTILSLCAMFIVTQHPFFHEYRGIIYILSIGIVLGTIGTDWINTIFEDYLYITVRYIVLQLIGIVALFLFVKNHDDLIKYAIINLTVSSGGNIFNIFYIRKKIKVRFTFKMRFFEHIVPLLILFFNNIASSIYLNSDITLLGFFTDDFTIGVYSNASKSYSIIKGIINAAVAVLVPRFSYYVANGERKEYETILFKIIKYITVILVPVTIGMVFEAEGILEVLGGHAFIGGAGALRILSVAMVPAVFACILSYCVLMPLGNELFFMISTISAALLNILLNFIFIPMCGIEGAAITTLIAELIVVLISLKKVRMDIYIHIDIKDLIKCILGGLAIVLICVVVSFTVQSSVIRLILSGTISAPTYFGILYLLKHDVVIDAVNQLFKRKR